MGVIHLKIQVETDSRMLETEVIYTSGVIEEKGGNHGLD